MRCNCAHALFRVIVIESRRRPLCHAIADKSRNNRKFNMATLYRLPGCMHAW